MNNQSIDQRDLVLLVADKDMEFAIRGMLSRPDALGIRSINYDIYVHVTRHDPGCCMNSDTFLRQFTRSHKHAIVVFDLWGCGREEISITTLQNEIENDLRRTGWENRARVIVIDPELEIWVWSDSPHVSQCLGWSGNTASMRTWLGNKELWPADLIKPPNPELAFKTVLREAKTPKSSRIFQDLATKVSFRRCGDRSFSRLCDTLNRWFPKEE